MDLEKIGRRLKEARKEKGYSLRTVGDLLRVDYSYLGKIENGKVKNPSLNNIEKLCKLYGISEASLFGEPITVPNELNEDELEWISFLKKEGITQKEMKEYIKIVKRLRDMS